MIKDTEILKYAEYVEDNKKRLLEHCKVNNKIVSETNTLSEIVTANNEINYPDKLEVTFVDIDGTVLLERYLNRGESCPLPPTPNYDSEYLEFDYWEFGEGDINNVTHPMMCGAVYKVKKIIDPNGIEVVPTILKCYFDDSTTLNANIRINTSSGNKVYIDWGDGTIDEKTTSTDTVHTYSSEGYYVIKIYSENPYYIFTSPTRGILGTKESCSALLSIYLGNLQTLAQGFTAYLYNLRILGGTYPAILNSGFVGINDLKSLYSIVLPKQETYNFNIVANTLTYIIIPKEIKSFGENLRGCGVKKLIFPSGSYLNVSLSSNYNLETLYISNDSTGGDRLSFNSCYKLKNFPEFKFSKASFNDCHNLKNINFNNFTGFEISAGNLSDCFNLSELILPENVQVIKASAFGLAYGLNKLYLPSSIISIESGAITFPYNLEELSLGIDFNTNLTFNYSANLSDSSLLNIAKNIKNNFGEEVVNIITLSVQSRPRLSLIYLDDDGNVTTKDNGINLIEFIQNKNWTITFK